jgi:hypothetical protein
MAHPIMAAKPLAEAFGVSQDQLVPQHKHNRLVQNSSMLERISPSASCLPMSATGCSRGSVAGGTVRAYVALMRQRKGRIRDECSGV